MRYRERLSGPLMDRVDIYLGVESLEYEEMQSRSKAEGSSAVRARVNAARKVQLKRYAEASIRCNAHIGAKQIEEYCGLSDECEKLMKAAFTALSMTARSYDRILRVARTIADLEGAESIKPPHLAEAIQYRDSMIRK